MAPTDLPPPTAAAPHPTLDSAIHHLSRFSKHSWKTLWQTALVRAPRMVPLAALRITSPSGPQPYELQLPSRKPGRTIPLYIFLPCRDPFNPPKQYPVVVDFHGGGFYLGSCLEQAPFCAKLSRELEACVIGVDYRMAPFDKFPAAIEDAEDTLSAILDPSANGYSELRQSMRDHLRSLAFNAIPKDERQNRPPPPEPDVDVDTTRIAFSGASSGGNIALNLAIDVPKSAEWKDTPWPCRVPTAYEHQIPLLLLYPSLDLRQLPSERFRHERMPAVKAKKNGQPSLDDSLAATYVSRENAGHPRASPGLIDVSTGLHKQAKTLLVLSGLDTLWEQSEQWVKKVDGEGRMSDFKVMRYADRRHGWTTYPELWLSKEEKKTRMEVLDECVRFTKVAWSGRDPVAAMHENVPAAQGRDDLKFHNRDFGDDDDDDNKRSQKGQ